MQKKTKFVIIVGSVISGIGKGTFSASLANILKLHHGLVVAPIKFDGYLNYDAGTLNPYRHGEVFVLDDGTETDLDLGSYERMLNQSLTKDNYLTAGKIFKTIIDRERKGEYLGRDVQFVPHVTDEIKSYIKRLGEKTSSDVVLVEVGGTVGDIENSYFLEAMRQLALEEGKGNVCFVNVVYILEPKSLGEQKTKAAQLGTQRLMAMGIQPDVIVCRSEKPVTVSAREKISAYSNVTTNRVVSLHDLENILEIPIALKKMKVDEEIIDILGLKTKPDHEFQKWEKLAGMMERAKKKVTVAIAGKYTGLHDSYISILKALEHTAPYYGSCADIKWIETTDIENEKQAIEMLKDVDGLIVPIGYGSRGAEGKILCIKVAREKKMPFLGLCYGFQMAIVEFARNVCGIRGANSTEVDPDTKEPVIDILPEQKKIEGLGGTQRLGGQDVAIREGTIAHRLYGKKEVRERFRHRWECNPKYIEILEKHGMVFSGKHPKYPIMQILELPDNPYFFATQYHPEYTSRPLEPNPAYKGFVEACVKHAEG
ncbi:MAG: CTP synthase (glutamine hydrolyzing) [Candidatus Aenigmarchaeota archaeon]|nr:CTP synthase (glutamine hydrolyzing) [Candidatus Aenigmarchaeota archaeon]